MKPVALIIEDRAADALLIRRRLTQAGFQTRLSKTAQDGIEQGKSLLSLATNPQLDIILLDWLLPQSNSPSLEGIVVAVELIRAMDEGEIHPAHIAVLSHDLTHDRRNDALSIGCSVALEKPLNHIDAQNLLDLIGKPLVFDIQQRRNYKRILRFVKPTLELLYEGQDSAAGFYWTRRSAKKILLAGSLFDLGEVEQICVKGLGGFDKVKNIIKSMKIDDEKINKLRTILLDSPGDHWEILAEKMKTNKVYIYDWKNILYDMIAERLNTIMYAIETQTNHSYR